MAVVLADGRRWQFTGASLPMVEPNAVAWEQRYGPKARMAIEPLPDVPVRFDLALRAWPGLGILSGAVCGVRNRRGREHVADGRNDFTLFINRGGLSIHATRGRELDVHSGEAVMTTLAEPRTHTRPGPTRYLIVRLPRATLSPLVPNVDDTVLRVVPRGTLALRLLADYARSLMDEAPAMTAELRRTATTHLADLVALAIGATRDAAAIAQERGIRAARLRSIKCDIEDHLASPALTPGAIAARQGISDSYMRKLFEGDGTSFTDFVLARRLARAHAMLSDPRLADRSITSIAFTVGFGDLSYFNRTFRRRFGATPSQIRDVSPLVSKESIEL